MSNSLGDMDTWRGAGAGGVESRGRLTWQGEGRVRLTWQGEGRERREVTEVQVGDWNSLWGEFIKPLDWNMVIDLFFLLLKKMKKKTVFGYCTNATEWQPGHLRDVVDVLKGNPRGGGQGG